MVLEFKNLHSAEQSSMEHQAPYQPWADLPSKLLSRIATKRSADAAAYVSLRRVCQTWRRSLTDNSPIPSLPSPQLPFLLVPPQTFPNPSIGKVFPIPCLNHCNTPKLIDNLPSLTNIEDRHRICVGSSHGWLITLHQFSFVSLLNPVTGDSILLEPLSSINKEILSFSFPDYHLKGKEKSYNMLSIVHLAILSSDPAKDRDFILLLFLSGLTDCCFTCRGRDRTWNTHEHRPFLEEVEDVVFINGVFVVYVPLSYLIIFDFRNHRTGLVQMQLKISLPEPTGRVFLVNSDGHLIMVYTHLQPVTFYGWIDFALFFGEFAADGTGNNAVSIQDPSEIVMFLAHGCSVAVSRRHFPWLMAPLYFTLIYNKLEMEEGGEKMVVWQQGAVTVYQNIISFESMPESFKIFDLEKSQNPWFKLRQEFLGDSKSQPFSWINNIVCLRVPIMEQLNVV